MQSGVIIIFLWYNVNMFNFMNKKKLRRWWGFALRHFAAGIFRGMGFALGFFLLSALALYLLNLLVDLGIPVLGDFIAQLLFYVQEVQRVKGLV